MSRTLEDIQRRFPKHVVELACRRQGLDRESQLVERPDINDFMPPKTQGQSPAARRVIAKVNAESYDDNRRKLLAVLEEECLLIQPAVDMISASTSPKAEAGTSKSTSESTNDVDLDLSLRPHQSVGDANLVGQNDRFSRMAAGSVPTSLVVGKCDINTVDEDDSDFVVPEGIEIPDWIDKDGDGKISREEFEVFEKEMRRAAKIKVKNDKEIAALLAMEAERTALTERLNQAEMTLLARKKEIQREQKLRNRSLAKHAQEMNARRLQQEKLLKKQERELISKYKQKEELLSKRESEREAARKAQRDLKVSALADRRRKLEAQQAAASKAREMHKLELLKMWNEKEEKQKADALTRQKEIKKAQMVKQDIRKRRLAKARKQVEDHTKWVAVSAERRMQEAKKRQLAHAEKRKTDAHEAKRRKELRRMEIQLRKKEKQKLHDLHMKELQEIAHRHEMIAAEQRRVLELENVRKRAYKEARLRAKQDVAARNRRIQNYRAEVLRKAADRDNERHTRAKSHKLALQKHRKDNMINAWRQVELLKASFEKKRITNKSTTSGSSSSGISPRRPTGGRKATYGISPRNVQLAQPKTVYVRPSEDAAREQPETMTVTLDPYRRKAEAICHVKEKVVRVNPPSTILSKYY
eukprot:g939.t1